MYLMVVCLLFFFFFNDTATTEIYTLSLHDALPIFLPPSRHEPLLFRSLRELVGECGEGLVDEDRKSTRLNSSHSQISYAVFCLKKKKKKKSFSSRIIRACEIFATIKCFFCHPTSSL